MLQAKCVVFSEITAIFFVRVESIIL